MVGNLNINQISEGQDDKEVTINLATLKIDLAMTDWFDVDVTAGNVTLASLEFEENIFFRVQNATVAGRTLVVPATKRLFAVESLAANTQNVDIVRGTTTITLTPGDTGMYYTDGTANGLVAIAGGGGGGGTWLSLTDTESSFSGQAGKVSAVNSGETALEFIALPTSFIAIQPLFKGALLNMAANQTGLSAASWTPLVWGASEYDTTLQPDDTGLPQKFWLGSDLTFTADNTTEQLTATAHGMNTGDGPFRLSNSGGALPTGLAAATDYWCINVSANVLKVAASRANAIADTEVAFTTDGTGTHTLERETWLVIPEDVTKIRLTGGFVTSALTAGDDIGIRFAKNEVVTHEGGTSLMIQEGTAVGIVSTVSPVLEVVAGDRIEMEAYVSAASEDILNDVRTYFSVEVVEETKALSFPGVTVERPHLGAIATKNATQDLPAAGTWYALEWQTEIYDTGYRGVAFHDNATNNTRMTVPAGVTKIRLSGGTMGNTGVATSIGIRFTKNGAEVGPTLAILASPGFTENRLSLVSPVIEVVEGDYFELEAVPGVNGRDIISDESSYFSMEVVETDEAAFVPEQVETFLNGVPVVSDLIYQKVAHRRFSLSDNFVGSQAYAVTAPSASTTFDVDRNGTKIGEIVFASASNTATFTTTAATEEVFETGDLLSIDSPSNLNSLADISFSLKAWRS